LVLVPTRELALQTSQVCKELGKYIVGLEVMVTTGGTSLRDDIVRLQSNVNIVVATPGRMLDLVEKKVANMENCDYVAMDEADKLLCQEFQEILEKLISLLPPKRQLVMFSATFPISVKSFKDKFLNDPVPINLMDENGLTLIGITQYYAFVEERQKIQCLYTLFKKTRYYSEHYLLQFCGSCSTPCKKNNSARF